MLLLDKQFWYKQGQEDIENAINRKFNNRKAKNVGFNF
jgi:hypothetical protein